MEFVSISCESDDDDDDENLNDSNGVDNIPPCCCYYTKIPLNFFHCISEKVHCCMLGKAN